MSKIFSLDSSDVLFIISIHALTKSATLGPDHNLPSIRFQSTHSRRVRPSHRLNVAYEIRFQSTHSRRVRRPPDRGMYGYDCFNPRTHEECDPFYEGKKELSPKVSIHALTKSATTKAGLRLSPFFCFNPRTHEECDDYRFLHHR